jgi:hypothetical protein
MFTVRTATTTTAKARKTLISVTSTLRRRSRRC